MLLLSSCAGTHSAAPFFRCRERGHFVSQLRPAPMLIGQNFNMKFCSLSKQILLFNPAFEMAWNSL